MSVKSKNIHVLPTDKPSRLVIPKYSETLLLADMLSTSKFNKKFNLYITSDEEIKRRDWVYCKDDDAVIQLETNLSVMLANNQKEKYGFKTFYKIILTTDQDLIKDGVQEIPDEFLEWFVKNPSCERVEVEESPITNDPKGYKSFYKIIIPKEEPKQETLERGITITHKQETLEEVAENFIKNSDDFKAEGFSDYQNGVFNGFIEGYKLAQQQMYSEIEKQFKNKDNNNYIIKSISPSCELDISSEPIDLELYIKQVKTKEKFKKK